MERDLEGGETKFESPIQFRCPCCRKLYAADARDLLGEDPKFACVACGAEFQMRAQDLGSHAFAAEIELHPQVTAPTTAPFASSAGFPAPLSDRTRNLMRTFGEDSSKLEPAVQTGWTPCPRCYKSNPPRIGECRACGVVFAKWRPEERPEADADLGASIELARAWQTTLVDWENEDFHARFIWACSERESLAYASRKYSQILTASPNDEVAEKMRGRIVLLSSAAVEAPLRRASYNEQLSGRRARPHRAKARASSFFNGIGAPEVASIAIALSSAILTAGLLAPDLRELATLGGSMLIATLGVRFWLRG